MILVLMTSGLCKIIALLMLRVASRLAVTKEGLLLDGIELNQRG
jgi:hypothetical protein